MGRNSRSAAGLFWGAAMIAVLVLAFTVISALAATAATAAPGERDQAQRLGLKPLGSCDRLRGYLRAHPRALASYAISDGAFGEELAGGGAEAVGGPVDAAPNSDDSAPAPSESSPTNVQEAGVDEPDIVKAAGSTIFSVDGDQLRAVDVGGEAPVLSGTLKLPGGGTSTYAGTYQLLLAADRMLAIGTSYGSPTFEPGYGYDRTILVEIDVSDPAQMTVLRTATVEGSYVSARLAGNTARIVTNDVPTATVPEAGHGRALVPKLRLRDRASGESKRRMLVDCADVRRPSRFAGPEMLSVLTIDMAQGLPAIDVDSVMTNGEIVYASTENLYVASQRWVDPETYEEGSKSTVSTEIHRFDVSDPASTTYVASGRVDGFMLSQWSLSEHEGLLRVASTTSPPWVEGGQTEESESFVTVLAADLEQGRLRDVGHVGGLGRGEEIYAVRFIGATGYVVTFRQVDPLYTLDLSDPLNPRVVGELKIPGYSAYLHPVGEGLLLGVGQDATAGGQTLGVNVSLFDVADPANPVRLDQQQLGGGYSSSEVEYDHHAFSYFPEHTLATVPVESYGPSESYGAFGLRIAAGSADPLSLVAKVAHGAGYDAQIRRTLVIGDHVYTVSATGIAAHDPATLTQSSFIAF